MRWTRACRTAISLFTVLPAGTGEALEEGQAARAVLWMPAVGLLPGILGGAVLIAAGCLGAGDSGPRRLLGAALAVAVAGLLTGGLHLDGLADTADGLGSRRPAPAALDIMRRSDVGPMGVATLILVLLIQVAALAAVPRAAAGGLSFVLATVTGRVAVVLATGSDAARPGGFGALVAGHTTVRARAWTVVLLACAIVAVGLGISGPPLIVRGLVAAAVGLGAGSIVRLSAVRRLGGVTGDVFGAVLEIATAATLVACALAA